MVMCPAFVSDCLETIEEIGMRGCGLWRSGKSLPIPCMNEHHGLTPSRNAETFLAAE
jgi:ferrochelatase